MTYFGNSELPLYIYIFINIYEYNDYIVHSTPAFCELTFNFSFPFAFLVWYYMLLCFENFVDCIVLNIIIN